MILNQYIIAICGSAGSLKPLQTFFDHTPINNASYIILRHLPIAYNTTLDSVLKAHAKLDVMQATPGASIEKDKVYYAPPSHHIRIQDGRLQLIQRAAGVSNQAIDIFLESLAQDENKRKAIAVFLSGTGSDGIDGATAIKKAGGLVIVQTPESCEHASLPLKIIQSGNADFVLEPADMPVVIQGYANRYEYKAES